MTTPTTYPDDVMKAAREAVRSAIDGESNMPLQTVTNGGIDAWPIVQAAARAILAERERAAGVAERDADWSRFGKTDIQPWENGPDDARDYRIGIAAGRAIAAAIRKGE